MGQDSFTRTRAALLPHAVVLLAAVGGAVAQVSADGCTECFIHPIPVGGLTIGWKAVDITAITVATATIVIDTEAGLTSTKTAAVATITADENGNQILDDEALEKFWSSQVTPAGALKELNVIDGTPTATVTNNMVKGPGAQTIISGTIAWPTKYEHQGFAASYYLEDTCAESGKTWGGETWALTPTITDSTYPNPYDYPIKFGEWTELLPSNDCHVNQVAGTVTGVVLTQARAVTNTVTSYGVVQNRQEATPKPSSGESDADDEANEGNDKSDSGRTPSETGGEKESAGGADPTSSSSSSGVGNEEAASESSGSSQSSTPSDSNGASSARGPSWHWPGMVVSISAVVTTLFVSIVL